MESKKVPNYGGFLIGVSKGKLKKLRRLTKNKKEADRLLACVMRKKGRSIQAIADELEIPYTTMHRWLVKIAEEGLKAIYDRPKPGRPCRLTTKQLCKLYRIVSEDPREHGFEGGAWTARRLIAVAKKEFGAEYGERGMQLLLHRIGLTCRLPRPRHPKAATAREAAKYKRRVAAIRGRMGRDAAVCMIDSAALIAGWNVERGWYPRGESKFAPVTLSSTRAHMLGALYDGELDLVFPDKVDKYAIEKFLRSQLARHGKVIVILDNASWHHAKNVRALEDEFAGRLRLVHLPPYTPELNSIELVWRMIRKAIANTVYETVDGLTDAVTSALLSRDVLLTSIAGYAKAKNAKPPPYCTVRVEGKSVRNRYYL